MVELPLLALGVQIPVRTNEIPRLLFKLLISLTRRIGICTNILDPCQTEATFKKSSQHVPISDVGIGLKNYSGVLKSKHVGFWTESFCLVVWSEQKILSKFKQSIWISDRTYCLNIRILALLAFLMSEIQPFRNNFGKC